MNPGKIIMERNCGHTSISFHRNYSYGLLEIIEMTGLKGEPVGLRSVESNAAMRIIELLLWKDMAYDIEIMPRNTAKSYAEEFISELADDECSFYTNIDVGFLSKDGVGSASSFSEATFDAGILAIHKDYVVKFWIEDED